ARQALDLQCERQAYRRVVEERPGARGVRQHDVSLQLLELAVRDARLREATKARVDAIGRLARGEDALHCLVAVLEPWHTVGIETQRRCLARNGAHLVERQPTGAELDHFAI